MNTHVVTPTWYAKPIPRALLAVALCVCLGGLTVTTTAWAQPANAQVQRWQLPAGRLAAALDQLGTQSRLQIVYSPELLGGLTTPGLSGEYTPAEALRRLLEGTGIAIDTLDETTFVLRRANASDAPMSPSVREKDRRVGSQSGQSQVTDMSGVTVTGTRIKGAQPSSPLVVITQEDMRLAGHHNLGQALRALPQNFNGGQNPEVALGSQVSNQSNGNTTGSSSLNLRGLGPDATLTLLNGARLPHDGYVQATDVTAIPAAAVDRIEILLDGASAVYGSDAVGGVANLILKRDYVGAEASARFGVATDGGFNQTQYSLVAGNNWGGGGLLVTADVTRNSDVDANQRRELQYLSFLRDADIYPKSDQKGVLLSGHQVLGAAATVQLDAFYTERDQTQFRAATAALATDQKGETQIWGVSPAIDLKLAGDWSLRVHGAMGRSTSRTTTDLSVIATGASSGSFGSGLFNKSLSAGVESEGPIFRLPGGVARLGIGAGWRHSELEQRNLVTGGFVLGGETESQYGYGEINLPIVSDDLAIPAINRLLFNAAVRFEDYKRLGSTATPRLGLVWGVIPELDFKASWGESFKAPTLLHLYQPQSLFLYAASAVGGALVGAPADGQVIFRWGGNPYLKPETAETVSSGFVFRPSFVEGLDLEASWFSINYTDRVRPPITNVTQTLSNPAFGPVITRNPSSADVSESFDWAGLPQGSFTASYLCNVSCADFDAAKVFAIVHASYMNVASDKIRGVDLSARYLTEMFGGYLSLAANGSWINRAKRRVTSTSPETQIAGVVFHPARFRGRMVGSWSRDGFTLSSAVNNVGGVTDTVISPNKGRGSMTTWDVILDYSVESSPVGAFGVNLAVTNLFNRTPPIMQPAQLFQVNYDSTNYSALGRIVSLTLVKQF